MIYKLLLFLFFSTLIFSKDILIEGDSIEKQFFYNYLTENFQVNSGNFVLKSDSKENLEAILIILDDNLKNSAGNFQRIHMNGNEYIIDDTQVKDYLSVGTIYAEFYSPWRKIPYIWKDGKNIYINGFDLMKDPSIKIVFEEFLLNHFDKYVMRKEIIPPIKTAGDITKTTNRLSIGFVFGVLILVLFLIITRKKGYGNPFKGE